MTEHVSSFTSEYWDSILLKNVLCVCYHFSGMLPLKLSVFVKD